jgi:hypothetical protein
MSRKSQYLVHKMVNEGMKIDVEIIVGLQNRLIDSDLLSQIHGFSDDHGIASATLDCVFEVSNLFLRITHGRKHPTNI